MNKKGNKRHQETLQRIHMAFASMLREQELNKNTVTELCKVANIDPAPFMPTSKIFQH